MGGGSTTLAGPARGGEEGEAATDAGGCGEAGTGAGGGGPGRGIFGLALP